MPGGAAAARRQLDRLTGIFGGRVHVELQRHRLREEEHRNQALIDLARTLRLPLLATNGVRYARPEDKSLHDVLTAIRHHTTLDAAGGLLAAHRERHFKGATEMARLFADLPEAVAASAGIIPAGDLDRHRDGETVRTAGAVIVRQRPGTAKGLLFLTLEDETKGPSRSSSSR